VVEELDRVGAEVHLAEPAEASALKGKKKRAKTDWADARHLRELLLIGRVPESWIPPAHILDLRARVRGRHLLSHQRTEWQQRMHSVLYHHGCPQRRNVLSVENREWLAGLQLPAAAREQIEISLQIIDAIDTQLIPFDRDLRGYARKQSGCRALIDQIYGVGELTAVTILAELGDTRRFHNSRDVVRYSGLEMRASNCTSCSGDSGLSDVAGVRDPFAVFLFDLAAERDPQAVGAVAVGGELAV
jgi:transposase